MHLFEKYISAVNSGDADAIASLFAVDGVMNDSAARTTRGDNGPDFMPKGREEIRTGFSAIFKNAKVVATILKLNDNSMEYDAQIGDFTLHCIGAATCNSEDLIVEYIVRQR